MGNMCKVCGTKNPSKTSTCFHCGAVLGMTAYQPVNCGFCGKINQPFAEVCECCGAYLLKRPRLLSKSSSPSKDILPPSVEIRVLPPTPVYHVRFPHLPPPPVEKPKERHVKPLLKSIAFGSIYVGFFAFIGWLLVLFFSIFF
jgi:hypothetical protein